MTALRIERDGPFLRVNLARPERRNAFDAALIAELRDAFADVGDARAVVLAGDGESFCAGADVKAWSEQGPQQEDDPWVAEAHAAVLELAAANLPTVALLNGAAVGAGAGLVEPRAAAWRMFRMPPTTRVRPS